MNAYLTGDSAAFGWPQYKVHEYVYLLETAFKISPFQDLGQFTLKSLNVKTKRSSSQIKPDKHQGDYLKPAVWMESLWGFLRAVDRPGPSGLSPY